MEKEDYIRKRYNMEEVWYIATPKNLEGKIETNPQAYFLKLKDAEEYKELCPNMTLDRTTKPKHFEHQIFCGKTLMASFKFESHSTNYQRSKIDSE